MKFDNVKLNDEVLVKRHSYGPAGYYKGKVTHVTKTRFTVAYADTEQVFTKDGREFPRSTGFHRSYIEVSEMDEVGLDLIRKHKLANKARNLAGKLDDIFGNANYREQLFNMELRSEEIEENIKLLETVYEKFKKYGPKEAT